MHIFLNFESSIGLSSIFGIILKTPFKISKQTVQRLSRKTGTEHKD